MKVNVKAILLGVLAYLVCIPLSLLVLLITIVIFSVWHGVSPNNAEMMRASVESGRWLVATISFPLGIASLLLGGFVAGRAAGERHYMHGAIVGVVVLLGSVVLAILFPAKSGSTPHWLTYADNIFYVPAGLVGGFLAKKYPRRSKSQ